MGKNEDIGVHMAETKATCNNVGHISTDHLPDTVAIYCDEVLYHDGDHHAKIFGPVDSMDFYWRREK